MASELTIFIKEQVYPALNAVEAGLLDHLSPKVQAKGTKQVYSLTCPKCEHSGEAFYYAGSGYVNCNRQNKCGESTSVWDIVEDSSGKNGKEIAEQLCAAVGLELPKQEGTYRKEESTLSILKKVLHESLMKSKKAKEYLIDSRGWNEDEIENAPFGYIASFEIFYSQLKKSGADMGKLSEWGIYFDKEEDLKKSGMMDFQRRLTGVWVQTDGSAKLWGRLIRGPKDGEKKYKFQYGLDKTIPCFYEHEVNKRNRDEIIGVEGNIDAARLLIHQIPSVATGGATFTNTQAIFLSKNHNQIFHWIDSDQAGINGGVRSIVLFSSLGVNVKTVEIEQGQTSKDADDMISEQGADSVKEFLKRTLTDDGVFLSNRIFDYLSHEGDPVKIYEYARKIKDQVSGRCLYLLQEKMSELGIDVGGAETDALKIFTKLYELGNKKEDALKMAKRKTGIDLMEFFRE